MWQVIDTGVMSAEENMCYDAQLLEGCREGKAPILHLYDWQGDSATYGYLVNPYDFLVEEGVKKRGLSLARRPTGGGIIFHLWDLAFSVAIPSSCALYSENTLQNYALINGYVLSACEEFIKSYGLMHMTADDFAFSDICCQRFCMARPTKYDVIMQGKKVAGAAQRKTKHGFLHQGTISLMMPSEDYLRDTLISFGHVMEAMFASSFALMGPDAKMSDLAAARYSMKQLLIKYITREG